MRSLQREPGLLLALLAVIALVALFILSPQIRVILTPGTGYVDFMTGGSWQKPLINSLEVMALSTTSAVILGFVFAYGMVYTNMPWKPFFGLIGILPLLSPPFVVAAAYVILFGPRGLITYGIFGQTISIFGLGGIWGVQTIAFFPFAYQLIADVLSRSDARLEQAARNLGAGPWQVFRSVTLPLSGPGLGAAILTCAIYILEDFGNPQLIGGGFNVLPNESELHAAALRVPRRARRVAPELVRLQHDRRDRLLDLRAVRGVHGPARHVAGPEDLRLPAHHAGGHPRDLLRDRLPHRLQ